MECLETIGRIMRCANLWTIRVVCGERKSFEKSLFIAEDDKNVIPEFNIIVSFELFDFNDILIFNSFDERHNGFRLLSSFIIIAKEGSSLIFTLFSLPAKAELTTEAEEFLLTLTRAYGGSFVMTHFKVLALNMDFDLRIDLIFFGPEVVKDDLQSKDESDGEEKENDNGNLVNDSKFDIKNEIDDNENNLNHVFESSCIHKNINEAKSTRDSHPKKDLIGANEDAAFISSGINGFTTLKSGGSLLDVIDELIKVGHAMGYNMDGCMKNIETVTNSYGDCQVFR
uniref:RNA-directed DNA polymerase, eukaryota, nucleotide-binding alpha-beta plait domain protein n=1 Tax=Tanacetum cinerariifolium TaxID=118510 RepID=A0A6L2MGA1_TANCI|nr:RNA-directed DNA polymerase, eukaryota, nucleotide-binding alpha-beta plait domain protein [Tanacetum cinerariifolium]